MKTTATMAPNRPMTDDEASDKSVQAAIVFSPIGPLSTRGRCLLAVGAKSTLWLTLSHNLGFMS